MITEKAGTIEAMTIRIGDYMDDIQEYLGQLKKAKIVAPADKETLVEESVEKAPSPEYKHNPLLPNTKEDIDKSLQEGSKDTAKG